MQLHFFVAGVHIDAHFCRELCHGFTDDVFRGTLGVRRNRERQPQEQQSRFTLYGRFPALIHGIGLLFSLAFHLWDLSHGQQWLKTACVSDRMVIGSWLLLVPAQAMKAMYRKRTHFDPKGIKTLTKPLVVKTIVNFDIDEA